MARLLMWEGLPGRLDVIVIRKFSRINYTCPLRRCRLIVMLAFRISPSCIMALSFIILSLRSFKCRKTNNFRSKALVIMKSTILSGCDTLVVADPSLVMNVMI